MSTARPPEVGRELYFASPRDEIVAVPVDLTATSDPIGAEQVLFRTSLRRDQFTPAPDGERFLVVLRLDPGIDRAVLVDGWSDAANR